MARFVELRRPGPDRPAAAGAVDGPTLAARLHEIGAAAAEPVDTLEPALHAILEATGAAAGAVCLFDARREVLRLAAEEGLSDEGCHQLRTVRRGDIASWYMPLHGLMNRRAYLIESAAQNRYVPPLVEAGAAIRTVACLPVYAGSVPVGSLVLITRTPRAFTERDLGGLQQPLREMAQLIEAVRRQASERAAAETPSLTAVPSPTPPTAARSEAPSATESAPADAGHDGPLAAALAAAQRENARLAMELERLRAEAPRDAVRLTEQTAEIDHLRAQLAEAEAGAAHEQRAREEIEAALARGSSGGHAELQLALDTARRAETARAALAAEHARLTAELERLHAGATHEELAGEHAAEVDRLRARLAEAEAGAAHEHRAREQLEAALERGASVGQLELRQALEAARQAEAARATLAAEKARLGDELERWRAEAVRAEPLKEALAHAETEHARLAAALEAATAERAEENRTEAARAQAKAAEHEAEMERVLARLAEAEATAAREERTRRALDAASEHEGSAQSNDVRQALEAARTAEEARDAAAIALAAARADLTRTLAQLEALREDAAGAQARATEGAATAAQLETVTGECDHLRAAVAALEAERDRLTADVEGAAAARVRLEEALAGALEEARARDQVLTGQLEVRTRESEALRSEHAAEVAATNARLETIINECDQLRTAAEALQAGRDRLAADVEGAAAARVLLEEALAREVEEARGRERELVARFEEREREAEALGNARAAETAAAIGRVETVVAECDQLRAALTALEAEHALRATEASAAAVRVSAAPAPARVAPASDDTLDAGVSPDPQSGRSAVVVVDVDRSWERIGTEERPVTVVAPDDGLAARLAELSAGRVVVNLTTPRALETLLALRAAGCSARFWGCLADPNTGRALPLGMIEPAARGLDPEAVLTSLGPCATRGTRVVTVGEDVDAFVSLRQALARQGMSVSMAWNAKQAEELLPLVRPAVVVLDLDLPAREACGIAAQLGACDPPPTTVLVAGSQDRAVGFAAALVDPARAHHLIPLDKLLARFLGRGEAPGERR
ncbi:MAG: hypothetical protein E6J76_12430 [Deltaproteobacteria bacterium]|nr:MAG: hypothetical protein E6J76_12430 [Deltaproteobacteria bacterium]